MEHQIETRESEPKFEKLTEYNLLKDKDTYQVQTGKNENQIIIKVSKVNELSDIFYQNIFTLEQFSKLDKSFRVYDEIKELYANLESFFKNGKVIINEIKNDSITLGIKIMSLTGEEKIVEILLNKKEAGQDSIVKQLCKKVNLLEIENKNLKEEINIIKNELNVIKNWKNENEENFKKLLKLKEEEIALKDIDSKILTKLEDLKFIEEGYKKNDQLNILNNKKFKPKLLYRATRDGDSTSVFHKKCNNINGTLMIVKTDKGFIFGGCTNEIWNEDKSYRKDDSAICFSLDLKKIYKSKKTNYSIHCNSTSNYGFGNYFFTIYDNCLSKGGMMNDGLNQCYDNQKIANEINIGESNYGIVEVEVFKIILE